MQTLMQAIFAVFNSSFFNNFIPLLIFTPKGVLNFLTTFKFIWLKKARGCLYPQR